MLHQYLSYIKKNIKQLETSEADFVMSQLKSSVVVVTTSHGFRQPSKDPVHFSSEFHPRYDLKKLFPGLWTVPSIYIVLYIHAYSQELNGCC